MRSLPLALVLILFPLVGSTNAAPVPLAEAKVTATTALARPDLAPYRGWLKYLVFQADAAAASDGPGSPAARAKIDRLADWTQRISADPDLLSKLRGVQEWAYESAADGSGQPFKIMIPTDYDPAHPAGVSLYMHGYSGDHISHSTGIKDHAGDFQLAVLGRSRGGGYIGLSQADVLHVLDYVEAHWKINPDQVHLTGGSMGGGGTYKLGARYPHRFASGQVTCGFILQEPLENLLTFPLYATHSNDDPVVPVLMDRGPLAELRRLGGQNIYDETTGFGHAVWNYKEGNERSEAWVKQQKRPASRNVLHLDFTAIDAAARRAWWAEVTEWGPAPQPARFILTAGNGNTLFADLTNINQLTLRIAESPFDRGRSLKISLAGHVPVVAPAPLPDFLVIGPDGLVIPTEPKSAVRLHTPGGALQLYNGEPLLIVYGTQGSERVRAALWGAADAASKNSNPAWLANGGDRDPGDQVPHLQNLAGRLTVKADTEVSDDDLARCHLVLIGTAAENSVVARLAAQLPVKFTADEIRCEDGFALPARDRAIGLVHFNPLAPTHLIFWVASSDLAGYAAGALIPDLNGSFYIGADLLIVQPVEKTLVATRSFDSHWHWTGDRPASPLLPARLSTERALAAAVAESVRRATAADFAVAGLGGSTGSTAITGGITRVADLTPLYYAQTIDVLEFSGANLLKASAKLTAQAQKPGRFIGLQPVPEASKINPTHIYRVAVPITLLFPVGNVVMNTAVGQHRADVKVDEAMERWLGKDL